MPRLIPPFSAAVLATGIVSSGGLARAQECSSWQPIQVASGSGSLAAAAWGNGEFWAFGNAAFASPTGSSWSDLGTGPSMELVRVRVLGGTFFAVGHYLYISTSPDGVNWTGRYGVEGGPPSTALNDIAWDGSTYVAVGFRPTESMGAFGYPVILVTTNLVSWTSVLAPPSGLGREELDGIVWTGTRFVAVGRSGNDGVVYVSGDGGSWTRNVGPGGSEVAWNGHQLVALGGSVQPSGTWAPTIWRSADGLSWQSTSVDPNWSLAAVTWDGARFVAVGGTTAYPPQAVIATSSDGVTWGPNETNVSENLVAVTSHFGTTVAVGLNGTVLTQSCPGGEPRRVRRKLGTTRGGL
ncbi:MAG: hypothetical protein ABR961_04520 [Thermoanaerobaculaceae bacterium]